LGLLRKTTPKASAHEPADPLECIRTHKWRQGSILPVAAHADISAVINEAIPRDAICVVVTQSCCLLHRSFDAEPNVEILVARPIGELNGNFTWVKNIRKLHFSILRNDSPAPYEVLATDRYVIPRMRLASYAPDNRRVLTRPDLHNVVAWLIARYEREAFPDSFQIRIRHIERKLQKEFRRLVPDVREVYISLHTYDELDSTTDYRIKLFFVMQSDDVGARERSEDVLKVVRGLLKDCEGIELEDDQCCSPKEINLSDLDNLRRWGDFDHLSYED